MFDKFNALFRCISFFRIPLFFDFFFCMMERWRAKDSATPFQREILAYSYTKCQTIVERRRQI
jgi:hypothetical protein